MRTANKAALTAAGIKNPHRELDTSEVYDKLRQAHQSIKDIYYSDGYEEKYDERQRGVIEMVNQALYVAEGFFIDF